MKNKIRVLIIDGNPQIIQTIKKYFKSHAVIDVVLSSNDGQEGLNMIIKNQEMYDMIILDLLLPHKDGISILEDMQSLKLRKKVIVLTSYNNEQTIKKVNECGVNYYMLKPFNIEDLEKRIIQLNSSPQSSGNASIDISITKLLHSLGIPSHIKGYQYIRDGIRMLYGHPNLIGGVTKEVYPEIATKYSTTSSRVERAIRHAIEVSWNRGDYDLMEELFGHSIDFNKSKPTNSEFIATIADKLRLDDQLIKL